MIQKLIFKLYRNSFERICIFSPSVDADDTWHAVTRYIKDVVKVDSEKEQKYFNHYDATALQKIMDTQHKVTRRVAEEEQRQRFILYSNGFADYQNIVGYSSILHGLFTRGRHNAISIILSTPKCNVVASVIRFNASALFVLRLNNMNEVNEENSALVSGAKELVGSQERFSHS